jgi:hypothetical protein
MRQPMRAAAQVLRLQRKKGIFLQALENPFGLLYENTVQVDCSESVVPAWRLFNLPESAG